MMRLFYRLALAVCIAAAVAVILGVGGLFWLTPDGPCLGLMSQCYPLP